MIRLLSDKTIGAVRYGKGSLVNLAPDIEAALIENGSAENLPVISRPIEILSGSAVAANCALTDVDEVLASFTIPGATLGRNSGLQIEPLWTFSNSPDNKILKVKIGIVTIYSATRTTSAREAPLILLASRNSLNSQIQPYDTGYVTAGSSAATKYSIDFSTIKTIEITGQRANAGDMLTLEYFRILHFTGK
jgi:hypothetical protein